MITLEINQKDFNNLIAVLRANKLQEELKIIQSAKSSSDEKKELKRLVMKINKESQVSKTKHTILRTVKILNKKNKEVTAKSVSMASKISLPTIYKYKDLLKNH